MVWIIGIIGLFLFIFFTGGFDRKHAKVFIVTATDDYSYVNGAEVTIFDNLHDAKALADNINNSRTDVGPHKYKLGVFKGRVFEKGDYTIGSRVY